MTVFGYQSRHKAPYLSCPQHKGCGCHHIHPVEKRERHRAEHLSAEGHYHPLSHEDRDEYTCEHLVMTQSAEGGMVGAERLGIEEVPELQHDEGGEEHRQFVCLHSTSR